MMDIMGIKPAPGDHESNLRKYKHVTRLFKIENFEEFSIEYVYIFFFFINYNLFQLEFLIKNLIVKT